MAHQLPDLPYAYDALEPTIDARTMEIHHGKHHAAYVSKLNAAIEGNPDLEAMSIEDLCANIATVPEKIRTAVRNNGGGHLNHSLFWSVMRGGGGGAGKPDGPLASAIDSDLGGFDAFKKSFADAAATRFGSGWAWLGVKDGGRLCVCSTPNQDNPSMKGVAECPCHPILGLDVWEHAYYLNYQNRRPDYIAAWWSVVDWSAVAKRFSKAGAPWRRGERLSVDRSVLDVNTRNEPRETSHAKRATQNEPRETSRAKRAARRVDSQRNPEWMDEPMKNALSRFGRVAVVLGIVAFAFAFAAQTGCETVKGAGEDLQSIGEAGQDAIQGDDADR